MSFTSLLLLIISLSVVCSRNINSKINRRPPNVPVQKAQTFYDDFYDTEFCANSVDRIFVHENCDQYYYCDEFDLLQVGTCDVSTPVFDFEYFECGAVGESICWSDDSPSFPDYGDSECPQNSNELVFIPGEYCDEYYICVNGVPRLTVCRANQHWNEVEKYCDDPSNAGCDPNHPPSLPDCQPGFTGTAAHPTRCNWFIYCENGNRSIQQCQHLYHYNIPTSTCLFMNTANCTLPRT